MLANHFSGANSTKADMSLLYAVGDVHGRADLLENLLDAINRDAETINAEPVIILGDIVDREPDSRQAMDLVQAAIRDYPGSSLILGNHDAIFRAFLDGIYPDTLATYWRPSSADWRQ